jgi:hypothetical protein
MKLSVSEELPQAERPWPTAKAMQLLQTQFYLKYFKSTG